jgi:hypothetical protein
MIRKGRTRKKMNSPEMFDETIPSEKLRGTPYT